MKRWIVAVTLVCAVFVAVVVLWPSQRESRNDSEALTRSRAATPAAPARVDVPRDDRAPPPGPTAAVQPALDALLKAPVPNTTSFEQIAPGAMRESFPAQSGKAFARGLAAVTDARFKACADAFKPPAGTPPNENWEGSLLLDVESSNGELQVVNATVNEASISDATLEGCLRDVYRGVRVPVSDVEPGLRYRFAWPAAFTLAK